MWGQPPRPALSLPKGRSRRAELGLRASKPSSQVRNQRLARFCRAKETNGLSSKIPIKKSPRVALSNVASDKTSTRHAQRSNREIRNLSRLGSSSSRLSVWHSTYQLPGDSSSLAGVEQCRSSQHPIGHADNDLHGEQWQTLLRVVAQVDWPVPSFARIRDATRTGSILRALLDVPWHV